MLLPMQSDFKGWGSAFWSAGLVGTTLLFGLLGSCVASPDTDSAKPDHPDVEQPKPPEMVPSQVSDRVLAQASEDLNLAVAELSILRVNSEVWSDGCLGLGRPDEGCLLALVPGWQVEVVHHDQSAFYRTDERGEVIRRSPLDNNLPPSIATKVIDLASSESGVAADQLAVTAAEPRLWNGCLGVAPPETPCTEIAIYGWQAVVEGNGKRLVYHTDMTGDDIRLNNL